MNQKFEELKNYLNSINHTDEAHWDDVEVFEHLPGIVKVEIRIEDGDWHHDHLHADWLIKEYCKNNGLTLVNYGAEQFGEETSGDWYSAIRTYFISDDPNFPKLRDRKGVQDHRKKVKDSDNDEQYEIARKYGIENDIKSLESDLLNINGVSKVDFDLRLNELSHINILVSYDNIPVSASDYYEQKKALKQELVNVIKNHNLTIEDPIEDTGEYFYCVLGISRDKLKKVEDRKAKDRKMVFPTKAIKDMKMKDDYSGFLGNYGFDYLDKIDNDYEDWYLKYPDEDFTKLVERIRQEYPQFVVSSSPESKFITIQKSKYGIKDSKKVKDSSYQYAIFQCGREPWVFMDFDFAMSHGFDFDKYSCVYQGTIDASSEMGALNSLWEIFNLHHPEGFGGHSMSVSDIVKINDTFYYCDDFGWKQLERYQLESRDKKTVNADKKSVKDFEEYRIGLTPDDIRMFEQANDRLHWHDADSFEGYLTTDEMGRIKFLLKMHAITPEEIAQKYPYINGYEETFKKAYLGDRKPNRQKDANITPPQPRTQKYLKEYVIKAKYGDKTFLGKDTILHPLWAPMVARFTSEEDAIAFVSKYCGKWEKKFEIGTFDKYYKELK